MNTRELLNELLGLVGIIKEYWDIFGIRHEASDEVLLEILQSLGFDVSTEDALIKQIDYLKNKDWLIPINPVFIVPQDEQPVSIPVSLTTKEVKCIEILLSSEGKNEVLFKGLSNYPKVKSENLINGSLFKKFIIRLPQDFFLNIGYYSISITINNEDRLFSRLIITPKTAFLPDNLRAHKQWGLSVNLYSLWSDKNWGVGDISDLKMCLNHVLKRGGSFVGINPLHSITNQKPYGISPYSPITKLFNNFIYIDVEHVDGFNDVKDKGLTHILKELQESSQIDYESVYKIKLKILKIIFEQFYQKYFLSNDKKGKAFKNYISEKGEALLCFSTYCVLAEQHGKEIDKPINDWRQWNSIYHLYSSKEVKDFQKKHKREILFYSYLQWLIDCQIRDLSSIRHEHPDCIGIYSDIAIGSIRGGSDEWFYRDIFVENVNVGAPPDDFNPTGQNWGFPPLSPLKLKEHAYEPLIRYFQENMRYAGAIRIDHALGLFRMFWIPQGRKASEGVYIEYPFEDILGIISLESQINKTIIIAEDLGTITDQARQSLRRYNMLSYRLLYFERRYPDPSFLMPDEYPEMAICAANTHDLPTIWGFWYLKDIELRHSLGMFNTEEDYKRAILDRQRDKSFLVDALKRADLLPMDFTMPQDLDEDIILSIYGFIAKSKSLLMSVSLDDIMGTMNQQNMPGTVDEYPCWVQKTPKKIETLFDDDFFEKTCNILSKYRGLQ